MVAVPRLVQIRLPAVVLEELWEANLCLNEFCHILGFGPELPTVHWSNPGLASCHAESHA